MQAKFIFIYRKFYIKILVQLNIDHWEISIWWTTVKSQWEKKFWNWNAATFTYAYIQCAYFHIMTIVSGSDWVATSL